MSGDTPEKTEDYALRPVWKLNRNDRCFCNSGKRFKNCCGSFENTLPHGVGLIPKHLAPDDCKQWVEALAAQPREEAKISVLSKSGSEKVLQGRSEARKTDLVDSGELDGPIASLFASALRGPVAKAFGRSFAWFEKPQVLRYEPGNHFRQHADSDSFDKTVGMWRKTMDRDVSVLLYLNEDFEGGRLDLFHFGYEYFPGTGDLMWFPSDHRYLHTANPVTSGVRWVIATWAAFTNEPRVQERRPKKRFDLDGGSDQAQGPET